MEKEHIQEAAQIASEASGGNWTPAAIVGSLLGLIIVLLLSIYARDRRSNDKRHEDNEGMINELRKISITQGEILAELKGRVSAK